MGPVTGPASGPVLSWVGDERIAISGVPRPAAMVRLAEQGVTHVVNCRPRLDVWWTGDLTAERAQFGRERVAHAPMQDHGLRQRPACWAAAAGFAARVLDEPVLDDQPQAKVLIHCTAGMHRSVMVAYAVLRLRGHGRDDAAALVLRYRARAELIPAYVRSVERWLATRPDARLHGEGHGMRVALAKELGGIDRVELGDLPEPVPAAGQVLVRVHGAGVGPWDVGFLGGGFPGVTLPFVPG